MSGFLAQLIVFLFFCDLGSRGIFFHFLFPLVAIAEQVEERSDLGREGCNGISLLGIRGYGIHCTLHAFPAATLPGSPDSSLDLWHVGFGFSCSEMG